MVILEDSIMQKGRISTAGSKILESFAAPFDAEVVARLAENNIQISGRAAMSEFGLGEIEELPGQPLLCNDVFGNYRRKAAEKGLCCIRPTYGTVSRYGLIPVVSSMDQIGIICKEPSEGFKILSAIAGNDEKDGAMFPEKKYVYEKTGKNLKISDKAVKPDYADVYEQVMYILCCAELSGNISRYDGIKFGYRTADFKGLDDLYVKTRTGAFGIEAKLAAVMGGMVLSQDYYVPYYEKAMKVRRLIKESLPFGECDVIIQPVGSPLASLAGLPSLTFNDMQLIADVKNENALYAAWEVMK
ncbi:MAG: amidase family protein [Oscillospiraceae bacterium]|nr:amidase family protein [Oscillospiraceae bacterium]